MPRFLSVLAVTTALLTPFSMPSAQAQTLDFSWPLNVGPLNPHDYSPNQMFAQAMVYEPLVKYQADGSLKPWLAESWTISEDGKTFTFKLRSGVSFSNGEAFNAAAVVKNFDAVLKNANNHSWLGLIAAIASVKALDDQTVEMKIKDVYYPFLQELALVRPVRFLAPAGFPASGDTGKEIAAPIGTGPWILSETVQGQYDVFTRNENYWGEKPAFESVKVKVIADANTRAIALQTGEIDFIYGTDRQISPDTFQQLKTQGFTAEISGPYETMMLAMNTNTFPTKDKAVRLAITHAVDKDALIKGVYNGTQLRADTIFAPSVPYSNIGLMPFAFDRAKANGILDAAGWKLPDGGKVRVKDGVELGMEISYQATDPAKKSIAEVLQGDLAQIGIAVTLTGLEDSEFYARQTDGNFQMTFNGTWGAPYDPHAYVSGMRVPSHADYRAQAGLTQKAEIDAAIAAALASTDEKERQGHYTKALTILHDEAVYLPLAYITAIGVLGPDVKNLSFGATAYEFPFETLTPVK
jgi:nickel transport system substrate-binding protein